MVVSYGHGRLGEGLGGDAHGDCVERRLGRHRTNCSARRKVVHGWFECRESVPLEWDGSSLQGERRWRRFIECQWRSARVGARASRFEIYTHARVLNKSSSSSEMQVYHSKCSQTRGRGYEEESDLTAVPNISCQGPSILSFSSTSTPHPIRKCRRRTGCSYTVNLQRPYHRDCEGAVLTPQPPRSRLASCCSIFIVAA